MFSLHRSLVQVFEKIPSLLYLYVQHNHLKEVPSGLPASLEQLRLSRNRISKIPAGAFNKMGNLTLLDLYHNKVHLRLKVPLFTLHFKYEQGQRPICISGANKSV